MKTRVVTVAHTDGAAGGSIGRNVAERLGFRYVDEQIIELAAKKHGFDAELIADAERRRGFLARFLEELGSVPTLDVAGAAGVMVLDTSTPRPEELRALIVDAIDETAKSGAVVIASHAAGIPLAGRDDVLRVLVTASFQTRAKRLASSQGLAAGDAERRLKEGDAGRADYFKRFYGIDRELPTHYDVVVNTDRITPEEATEIVLTAAGPSA
jgi:cytidylate kinase